MNESKLMQIAYPQAKGFTLIELMIAVAIVAILVVVALPAYQNHVVRAERAAAQAHMQELAQRLERCFTTSNAYNTCTVTPEAVEGWTIVFQPALTATSYGIRATSTRDTACSPLSLNHTGSRLPATCW